MRGNVGVHTVSGSELAVVVVSPTFRGARYDGAGMTLSCRDTRRSRRNTRYARCRKHRASGGSFSYLPVIVVSPAFHRTVRQYRAGEAVSGRYLSDAGRESDDVHGNGSGGSGPVSELSAVVHSPALHSSGERYRAAEIYSIGNLDRFQKVVDDDHSVGLFRGFSGIGSGNFEGRPGVERGGGSGYHPVRSER